MKKILSAVLVALIVISCFGCAAYVEHEKDFEDMVGTWELNCIYVDTKPVSFDKQVLVITSDGRAVETTTKVISAEVTDKSGNVTPEVTEDTTVSYTAASAQKGKVTFTGDASSIDYTFSVDVPAGDLHMYKEVDGSTYHYIYRLVEDDAPTEEGENPTQENQDGTEQTDPNADTVTDENNTQETQTGE